MNKLVRDISIAVVLCSLSAPVVLAQGEDMVPEGFMIEEILVTAEKREASIQDVPIAISAFGRDMRDRLGIISNADLANHTPSTTFNTNPNRVFIRGVGRVENSLGTEPGVAVYRDGIYAQEVGQLPESTFFTDHIEVLRGPQGTLYGRNAVGGAVNVVSKRPTDEFSGEVRAGAYSDSGYQLGLALAGPINDRFRYRVAAELDNNDGWSGERCGVWRCRSQHRRGKEYCSAPRYTSLWQWPMPQVPL